MNKILFLTSIVIIIIVSAFYLFYFSYPSQNNSFTVSRVIDGDTIELQNGERVRLLGIDTPEKGQYYYNEAKEWLEQQIANNPVSFEKDITDRDKYDRLLMHVFIGETHINLELVKLGLARTLIISPDEKYSKLLLAAEKRAVENDLGIWRYSDIEDAFCIGINYFHYNAIGNDNENLNDEYVIFRNSCTNPVNITNWVVKDNSTNEYIFPDFSLLNKTTIILHSGRGSNNATDLYWNKSRAVWNNNGDSLMAWNSKGDLVLDYSY